MDLRRGDIVILVLPRDYGKARPAPIVQSDLFAEHASLTVLPFTTDRVEPNPIRVEVAPNPGNGLTEPSHLMIDKIQTVPRGKASRVIGRASVEVMRDVERNLALFLGFA